MNTYQPVITSYKIFNSKNIDHINGEYKFTKLSVNELIYKHEKHDNLCLIIKIRSYNNIYVNLKYNNVILHYNNNLKLENYVNNNIFNLKPMPNSLGHTILSIKKLNSKCIEKNDLLEIFNIDDNLKPISNYYNFDKYIYRHQNQQLLKDNCEIKKLTQKLKMKHVLDEIKMKNINKIVLSLNKRIISLQYYFNNKKEENIKNENKILSLEIENKELNHELKSLRYINNENCHIYNELQNKITDLQNKLKKASKLLN